MTKDEYRLTGKEKFELAVEAGLQSLPYVGGSLATLYFGSKQEKRFKRIESFYQDLSDEIRLNKTKILPLEEHDKEKLIAIIEDLNEKVEKESTAEKKRMFKRYFISTLSSPINDNFDKIKYFLEALSSLSLLECEILVFLKRNGSALVSSITKPNTDQYAIVGSIGRLKSYGFVASYTQSMNIGGGSDNSLNEVASVSSYGNDFISYCLE